MTFIYFFFNDTATTEIYTLSLHDALPIWGVERGQFFARTAASRCANPLACARPWRLRAHSSARTLAGGSHPHSGADTISLARPPLSKFGRLPVDSTSARGCCAWTSWIDSRRIACAGKYSQSKAGDRLSVSFRCWHHCWHDADYLEHDVRVRVCRSAIKVVHSTTSHCLRPAQPRLRPFSHISNFLCQRFVD